MASSDCLCSDQSPPNVNLNKFMNKCIKNQTPIQYKENQVV